ncbi:MAG: 50S ribosomal protein L29 [Patescibacteria group bacterium]|nr:50S ribosomal protein L29 [Patescibacteria group bacterium]
MKYKELKNMSVGEARKTLQELNEKLHNTAVKHRLNQLKNTHELKQLKKDIARIMTFLHLTK